MIEYSSWRMGVDIVQFATTVGVWIYAWRKSRLKATDERFRALADQDKKAESDVQALRSEVQELRSEVQHPKCPHHPGLEHRMDKLNSNIGKVESGISKLEGRMEGIGGALDLIQQHLLSGGK